jgi:hypothetical protein
LPQKTGANTLFDDFCVLNFCGRKEPLSPFLGLFFGLWILYMDPSFNHSYETVKKIQQDPSEIGPELLVRQAPDLNSIETFGNPFG